MSDKDLQRVTESLSDIGQAKGKNPPVLGPVGRLPKLTPKEEVFCLAIVAGMNQSDAYRKAYKPGRAKGKTIHEKASRIMAMGKVQARIAELMTPVIAKAQMSRTEWLQIITKCCRFDLRKMFDAMGNLKHISEFDENERAAVAGFEVYEHFEGKGESRKVVGRTKKFKFIDRLSALALLWKACHYYADWQEQPVPDGTPIQQNLTVQLVNVSISPEEAYRRMVKGA